MENLSTITNAHFAKTDKEFLAACEKVASIAQAQSLHRYKDFKPSLRQASRWKNKKGVAWKVHNGSKIT